MSKLTNLLQPTVTFEFSKQGLAEMKAHRYWYQRKETYKLAVTTIAYIAIVALSASSGSVASMGSVEDSLIKAFFTKPPVGM